MRFQVPALKGTEASLSCVQILSLLQEMSVFPSTWGDAFWAGLVGLLAPRPHVVGGGHFEGPLVFSPDPPPPPELCLPGASPPSSSAAPGLLYRVAHGQSGRTDVPVRASLGSGVAQHRSEPRAARPPRALQQDALVPPAHRHLLISVLGVKSDFLWGNQQPIS